MCPSRIVKHIHKWALCVAYQDLQSSFSAVLVGDNLFTIHQNLQLQAIKIIKVKMNISPTIINGIFLVFKELSL